ncbi:MAG: hypothetical protein ACI4F0_09980 [Agathobacter sp.]
MKKQDGYYVEERRINIVSMLRWAVKQWKVLLVFAVLGSILVTAWQYRKDYNAHLAAYQNALLKQEQEAATLETYLNPLSDAQIRGAYTSLYYYRLIKESTDYMQQSLLMQTNPYEENRVTMSYQINGDQDQVITGVQTYIAGEEFLNSMFDKLGWETEKRYVGELISAEPSGTGLNVIVIAPDKTRCLEYASNAKAILETKFGASLSLVNEQEQVVVDQPLAEKYNTILENLAVNNENYKKQNETLTDAQDDLFHYLVAQENNETPSDEASEAEAVLEPTRISKKMAVAGIFIGAVVGLIVLMILYTFSSAVHGEEEIKNLFAMHVLGCVNTKKAELSYKQLERACAEIGAFCKKNEIKQILFTGSRMDKLPEDLQENLVSICKGLGIEGSCMENVVYDKESFEQAVSVKNVVLVEISEKSKCTEIAKELNTCLGNDISCKGIIMVEA